MFLFVFSQMYGHSEYIRDVNSLSYVMHIFPPILSFAFWLCFRHHQRVLSRGVRGLYMHFWKLILRAHGELIGRNKIGSRVTIGSWRWCNTPGNEWWGTELIQWWWERRGKNKFATVRKWSLYDDVTNWMGLWWGWISGFWGRWVKGCWWHILRGYKVCMSVQISRLDSGRIWGYLKVWRGTVSCWVLEYSSQENGLGWAVAEEFWWYADGNWLQMWELEAALRDGDSEDPRSLRRKPMAHPHSKGSTSRGAGNGGSSLPGGPRSQPALTRDRGVPRTTPCPW